MSEVDPVGATQTDPHGPPPAETEGLAGRQLAHFRLERPLGRGGMGEVWLATDLSLDRPVAVKILPPASADDLEARERFRREARAQARIHHPNVCHIYFVGDQDGLMFFAMELIDGESLKQRLDRVGKLPASEAIELCRQAALGLREAHRRGFTHRDVKPSNLLLDAHGVVKVVDFGLVKSAAGSGELALTGDTPVARGTPLYMSPEQARGDSVDLRSDIYSLGVTLHQLVAGTPPFDGTSPMEVLSQHIVAPRPSLPTRNQQELLLVDGVCARMMAKRPGDRFAGYDELVDVLERLSPSITRPAGVVVRAAALAIDLGITTAVSYAADLVWRNYAGWLFTVAYFIVGNALGRTPGKLAFELEVIPEEGVGRVGWRRAAIRTAVMLGPLLVAAYLSVLLQRHPDSPWRYALSMAVVVLSSLPLFGLRAAHGVRTPWDRAAGTRVVYRRVARPSPPLNSGPAPRAARRTERSRPAPTPAP